VKIIKKIFKLDNVPIIFAFLRFVIFFPIYDSIFISPQSSTAALGLLIFLFIDPVFGCLEFLSLYWLDEYFYPYWNISRHIPFIFIFGILGSLYWFFISKVFIVRVLKKELARTYFKDRKIF